VSGGRGLISAALAALAALSLTGCENNIERSAKLECIRLRHLAALKVARVDRKVESADCRAA
jgi:hypothetical protein